MAFRISHTAALQFYEWVWRIARPLLHKNARLAEGFEQRILQHHLPATDIWIQAASAGESYLAAAILENLKPRKPLRVLLTTNTRQGLDILQKAVASAAPRSPLLSAATAYFPFDSPVIMRQAVRQADPELVILLETEIWPGFLAALKQSRARTMIVNGRINEKYLKRYQLWPSLWRALAPDCIMAISPSDAERFDQLFGAGKVEVMPNMKFDRLSRPAAADQNPVARLLGPQTPFLVLGSIRQEEETVITKLISRIRLQLPEVVIGLFPRHMHRINQWKAIMSRSGTWQLRSAATPTIAGGTVVLWDTFGELSLAYQSATAAFVGGSLAPLGGQNFLEPLVCGVPPVIGPSWENFSWIGSEIIRPDLVRVASDWERAADLLVQDLKAPRPRATVQRNALDYIRERQGGTARACRAIEELLQDQPLAA